jgi:hypothetical protein
MGVAHAAKVPVPPRRGESAKERQLRTGPKPGLHFLVEGSDLAMNGTFHLRRKRIIGELTNLLNK